MKTKTFTSNVEEGNRKTGKAINGPVSSLTGDFFFSFSKPQNYFFTKEIKLIAKLYFF